VSATYNLQAGKKKGMDYSMLLTLISATNF